MKRMKISLLIAGFLVFLFLPVFAQDEEADEALPPETNMTVVMVKQADGSRLTNVKLVAVYEDRYEPIVGGEVVLSILGDSGESVLDRATTQVDGSAELLVAAGQVLAKDNDGYYHFTITYDGDETFGAASEEVTVRDFFIKLQAELIDSVKTLIVDAYGIGAPDSIYPFHEEEVGIFVQGMLSRLPLEAVWMEDGHGEIEFPSDLPGDADGNLTIYAAVLEHGDYGNVETEVERPWGKGFIHENEALRALWGSEAPWWMIIVLVILITGVWGHYLFAMIQLARVRRMGKNNS